MMVSLFAGVSGLKNHQIKMDVIGNNIANVNTVGFKKSTVNFEDLLSQSVANAKDSTEGGLGGINPIQIGLGSAVSSVSTIFSDGAPQITGKDSDIAISGDGMFMVASGSTDEKYYTRAGNFGLDGKGYLTSSNGMKVQGWQATKKADGTTEISEGAKITDLNVKLGEILPAKATTKASYSGNLDADAGLQDVKISVKADGNGTGTAYVDVSVKFTYDASNDKWNWAATGTNIVGGGSFIIDATGKITQSIVDKQITNTANSTVLIEAPTSGAITFKEKVKASNSVTSEYVTNKNVTSNQVYDSLGKQHTIAIEYTKIGENLWSWQAKEGEGLAIKNNKGIIAFDAYGQMGGNYITSSLDTTNPARMGKILDADGNLINSYPSTAQLGVAWDTADRTKYYMPEGMKNTGGKFIDAAGVALAEPVDTTKISYGDPTSPYELGNNGIIRYRGATDSNNNGIPDKDINGNTIQEVALTAIPSKGAIMNNAYSGYFSFDPPAASGVISGGALPPEKGAQMVKIMPDFNSVSQFSSSYSVKFSDQDGYSMGELQSYKISESGDITGEYSNGYKQVLGRIGLAKFFNPAGLEKVGGNMFRKTSNSGEPQVAKAGAGGLGTMTPGSLEMSNVDLAQEFTDMIIAQRGFQANSKTIATADQLLQDLINLKR